MAEELQEETVSGSDQAPPNICDQCMKDDRSIEARAFCSECTEYLCPECHQTHTSENVTMMHIILTGKDIPVRQTSKLHRKPTCSKHPDKALESLCFDHQSSCCVTCKRMDHGDCKTLIKLSELSLGENANEENELKLKSLNLILEELERLELTTVTSKEDLEENGRGTINAIRRSRMEIDERLDRLETDMITNVRQEINARVIDLETQKHEINGLMENVQKQKTEFEDKIKSGVVDEVIVTSTLLEFDIQKYNKVLHELHGSFFSLETNFSLDNALREVISCTRPFGDLEIVRSKTEVQRDYDDRQVVYFWERDINLSSNQVETKLISAMEMLPDGRLLLCDRSNNQIDLFGGKNEIISSIELKSAPWGMAVFSPKEIIISFPEKKVLQMFKISKKNKLKPKEKFQNFKTELPYSVLLKHNENLIACGVTDNVRYVDIISRHGRLIKRIRDEPVSGRAVSNTHCCSVGSVIFIADRESGCIGISETGVEIFNFRDEMKTLCSGICTTSDGYACLTGYDSDNVVLLKDDGRTVTELVKLKGFKPTGITYSKENNTMLVKVAGKSILKVFSLI